MHEASYYREQALRAQRLAGSQTLRETKALLEKVARDFEEIAEDLETGAIEIRHPEMLPQNNR